MRSLFVAAVVAALCGSLVLAAPRRRPPRPPPVITVCGILVEGVECTLLAGFDGGLYIVNTGGYGEGACICVTGPYERFCNSYCQQGTGCIYNSTVTLCNP